MSSSPYKILIIGPSWIGDMVMAQSLFIELKKQHPDSIIDVLALDWTKALLARMPEVNEAIAMPVSHGVLGIRSRYQLGKRLRDKQYDQAFVLPNSWKSALIPWFANIPIRTGWKGEQRYGLLNDIRTLNKQALPLMVERFVSLAHPKSQCEQAPRYSPPLMIADHSDYALPKLTENQKRLILCPGAEFGPAKQWPAEYYAEVASHLLSEGWQVVVLGSKGDRDITDRICSQCNTEETDLLFNLAGETTLEQAIDLVATADMVVSNDSGLMHIASALHVPLIVIYGATSPAFTPPLSETAHIANVSVDCGPCFQRSCSQTRHHCMLDVSSDRVLSIINQHLTLH